jgi:hypothetical protein
MSYDDTVEMEQQALEAYETSGFNAFQRVMLQGTPELWHLWACIATQHASDHRRHRIRVQLGMYIDEPCCRAGLLHGSPPVMRR